MRIFYITSVLGNQGGSEIYVRDIIHEMAKRGHEVCVATTEPFEFQEKNVEVFEIPVWGHHAFHKFTAPFFYGRIVKKAREFGAEVVQSHSNSMMGWIGDRVASEAGFSPTFSKKVAEKLKVPHVLLIEMISDKNANLHTKTIHAVEKFLLPKLKYDKVVVWTENMKNKFLLKWGVDEKRIAVIPAALNSENYNISISGERIKKKYGNHLIVSIKSLWSTNVLGLTYVVRAMKYVKKKYPEWKYLCVGPGDSGLLKKIAKEEGVEDVVLFPGNIPEEEKHEYWAATDISPHSFVYEFSTSISLLEYMAMGKACVISDVGAVREYVKDAALIVKAENPEAMADGIIKLIEDRKLRESLGNKARKLFLAQYSIESTVDRLEGLYKKT